MKTPAVVLWRAAFGWHFRALYAKQRCQVGATTWMDWKLLIDDVASSRWKGSPLALP